MKTNTKSNDNHFRQFEIFEHINIENLPWYVRAAQLLKFSDGQFQFDFGEFDFYNNSNDFRITEFEQLNNWFRKYNCFLIKYGEEVIAIYCCENAPKQSEVDRVLKGIGDKFKKLLIVMEEGANFEYIRKSETHEIEYHHQHQMIHELVDFRNYKNKLKRDFNEKTLPNANLPLKDVYIPLSAYHYVGETKSPNLKKGKEINNVEQYALGWVVKSNPNEHLAIVGEYGQGKSVLSLKIAIEMLDDEEKYDRTPIIIELSGKSPRNLSALDILSQFAGKNGLVGNALYLLHQAGKLLIILEGFDEMDLVGDTEMLMAHFRQLWQLAREPKAKIIITGRPNLFIDDPQRRKALGIHAMRSHLPYTLAIHLEKMNRVQIEQALRNSTGQTQSEILNAFDNVNENSSFKELVSRPSTLFQLSTVWDNELIKETENLNAAEVIGKFIQNEYERQDAKTAVLPLTANERSYFISGIAVGMMLDSGYTNQILKSKLKEIIQKLWDNYPDIEPTKYANNKVESYSNLKVRMKENRNDFDTILKDVIAGGILVLDLSGSDSFRFAHKSHLEYLISDFYVNLILNDRDRKYETKVAHAIRDALKFKSKQMVENPDLDNFIAQLISYRIQLYDAKTGKKLLIHENRSLYSKAIFEKIGTTLLERLFPSFMFWLNIRKTPFIFHILLFFIYCVGCGLVFAKMKNEVTFFFIFLIAFSILIKVCALMNLGYNMDTKISKNIKFWKKITDMLDITISTDNKGILSGRPSKTIITLLSSGSQNINKIIISVNNHLHFAIVYVVYNFVLFSLLLFQLKFDYFFIHLYFFSFISFILVTITWINQRTVCKGKDWVGPMFLLFFYSVYNLFLYLKNQMENELYPAYLLSFTVLHILLFFWMLKYIFDESKKILKEEEIRQNAT